MGNKSRINVIEKLKEKYGTLEKVGNGQSLFAIPSAEAIIYFRYSKLFQGSANTKRTFYGLRKEDIDQLHGKNAYICFLTDNENYDIVVPFNIYKNYFNGVIPATDGQYKTFTLFKPTGAELYINNVGKFNAETYIGIDALFHIQTNRIPVPVLTHTQVQSLIGSIGIKKGFDIWFPQSDRIKVDETILDLKHIRNELPDYNKEIMRIISEIDVIWLENTKPVSFYEVEHSTPIYSGLLRFNDVLLTIPGVDNFNIIAEQDRESKFGREVNRPTFKQNKLIEKVAFLDYRNIYNWHCSLYGSPYGQR